MSLQPKAVLAWIFLWLVVLLALLLTQYHRLPQLQRDAGAGDGAGGTNSGAGSHGLGQPSKNTGKIAAVAGLVRMLTTPITFHGTVVDQFGQPVPGAEVGYSLLDNFNKSGSTGKTAADQNGRIRITGVRGAVITVGVAKSGYYGVDGKSAQSFAYGTPPDDYRHPPPTAESPAVFLLHKRGVAAPLLHVKRRSHNVPRDGTPLRIQLATGQVSPTGELMVEAWTQEREPNAPRFYAWRCRISIPGGGILERKDSLQFEAPLQGLASYDEIAYTNERHLWSSRFEKEYFVRLPDNTFGRIEVYFTTGGYHFLSVESFLNLQTGNRNLEFDESIPPP